MVWIKQILYLPLLLVLQFLLVNNLQLLGVCHPYIYVIWLLMLPITLPVPVDMLIGAAVGLTVDVFCNSIGVHMASCVFLMFLRQSMIRNVYTEYERLNNPISMAVIGPEAFIKYAVVLVLIHHSAVFMLSAWSFHAFWWTLLEIIVSSLVSILLVLGYNLLDQR